MLELNPLPLELLGANIEGGGREIDEPLEILQYGYYICVVLSFILDI